MRLLVLGALTTSVMFLTIAPSGYARSQSMHKNTHLHTVSTSRNDDIAPVFEGVFLDVTHYFGRQLKQVTFSIRILSLEKQTFNELKIEADRLLGEGRQQYFAQDHEAAIITWKESLSLYQNIQDTSGEAWALNYLGLAYFALGKHDESISFNNQALPIFRALQQNSGSTQALSGMGLGFCAESHRLSGLCGEAQSLDVLGQAYDANAEYAKALELYGQALEIFRLIPDRNQEARTLLHLGVTHRLLGQYDKAIKFYEQALPIFEGLNNSLYEAYTLKNWGFAYFSELQHEEALSYYQRALTLFQERGDRSGEAYTLIDIGLAHSYASQHTLAIERYKQSLPILRQINDRKGEAHALMNIGNVYQIQGDYGQAENFYKQVLPMFYEVGDLEGQALILSNIGQLFLEKDQAELAIAFYKKAINTRTSVNQSLNDPLSRQSYLERVAQTYRQLEKILLEQGRYLETQQIVELFKRQELSDYTNDGQIATEIPGLTLLPEEKSVVDTYNSLVAIEQQLNICNAENCSNTSNLETEKERASQQYQSSVEQLIAFIQNGGYNEHPLLIDNFFLTQAKQIIAQQPDTVLIYPLVLDESIWLLWLTEDGVSSQRISNVNQQALTETISAFRAALEDRYSDLSNLQTQANQLYNWLIAPVETAVGNSEHLVLALDRNTRYVPMGAFYDGEQYLVEKYDISTILAASLTDTEERAPIGTENVEVLAAGVSRQYENFPALPNVPIELDNIVKEQNNNNDQLGIYSGNQILDPDFTAQTLRNSLSDDTRFLHIATHGEFVPGNRYSSYLLMGNGEKLPLPEIADLGSALRGVHLAVLSACQTALGGADEEGLEIAGLGYYFFKSDVDAVMASLWNVNDSSTSQLMQAFYQTLSEGTEANPITKAEALRTAQLSLLQSNEPGNSGEERFRRIPKNPGDQPRPDSGLAHPYYWAPFILIGNGL